MADDDTDTMEIAEPRRIAPWVVGAVVLAGAAFAMWRWLQPAPTRPDVSLPPAAVAMPSEPVAAAEPVIANPIVTPPDAPAAPTDADVESALRELGDAGLVQSLFRMQNLPRHIVATVDNLGREQASSGLWPVSPPPGVFTTDRSGEGDVIADANFARYARHVALLESINVTRAAQAYRRLYPLFQRAYENLGSQGKYFNDRMIIVIDQLLRTPESAGPIRVRLPEFGTDVKPDRPWVMYEFEDRTLQSLSSGQRILLRTGPDNMRRVKSWLRALRNEIARTPPA